MNALGDPDFDSLFTYLTTQEFPARLSGTGKRKLKERAKLKKQAECFMVQDGILYHRGPDSNHLQVIKDVRERQKIIKAIHEETFHAGKRKTRDSLLKRFWWPSLTKDVREFLLACETCHSRRRPANVHPASLTSHPWEKIGIDLCIMPTSTEGFTCLIVAVDNFSKWIEAEPLKNISTESISQFIYSLVCRHGCADVQINDQNKAFVHSVSTRLRTLTEFKLKISAGYHLQSNRLRSGNQRTIQTSLLELLYDPDGNCIPEDWPKKLPDILFALRSCKQGSKGYSPFFLMYGRHPSLPLNTIDETEQVTHTEETMAEEVMDISSLGEVKRCLKHVCTHTTLVAAENTVSQLKQNNRDNNKRIKGISDDGRSGESNDSCACWDPLTVNQSSIGEDGELLEDNEEGSCETGREEILARQESGTGQAHLEGVNGPGLVVIKMEQESVSESQVSEGGKEGIAAMQESEVRQAPLERV